MSKVERGQFSSLMRRYLGMTGTSDVLDELAPEISAVLALESERPEWAFLKNERLLGHATQSPAVVANFSAVRYRNPPNSGVVAIFNYVNVCTPNPGAATYVNVTHGAETTDQGTVSGVQPRDGRMIPPSAGAIIASFGTTALGGSQIDITHLLAGTGYPLFRGSALVLVPGFALNIGLGIANQEIGVSAHWLEKRLDALEAS